MLLGAAGVGAYFFSKGKLGKKWLGKLQKLLGIKPKVVLKEAKISAGTVRGNDLKYSADEIAANMDRVSSEYANSHAAKQKIYESVFKPIETPKLNFPA